MKIICIGWNYAAHNTEMEHHQVTEPAIFMKPDTALLRDNKPFYIPSFSSEIEHEIEIVVRINRLGKNINKKFAHRYYDEIGLGVDFTARDIQRSQRAKGGPWEIAKAFDNSAVISPFIPLTSISNPKAIEFSLSKNGALVQCGNTSNMLFDIDSLIAYVSQFFMLKIGDLIFTGTPSGVGSVAIGDHLEGFLEDNKVLDFFVK